MIRTVQKELSATSNVNAPKFSFRKYVRGQVYKNNSTDIDFVTDNGNLYVPVSDNAEAKKEEGHAKEDNNFMLLVAKGEQGEQGVKGEKGADGRTPAVYARFDGKQMVFYTDVLDEDGNIVYNDNGTRATRRIAATNDLTGPSWKPELVNDTIVWHKTKEDEAPKSIPLSSLIKQTAPVLLRVDSDNTRRMDEMDESGPANYIQWKYEGDEHWNNLISISELMNLTLAGVSIWYNEEDGHYHFGHKEVEKASYAASHTGKQIITAVELGEILYDAGPIPLEDWSAQIAALHDYICQVEEKIPTDYVKSVNGKLPDDNGNVNVPLTDITLQITPDKMLQISYDNGGTWSDVGRTCDCNLKKKWTVTIGTPIPADATMKANGKPVKPEDTIPVEDGDEVCITATAEGYQNFEQCYTITDNTTLTPKLTPIASGYCARVVVTNDPNNEGRIWMSTRSGIKGEETKELCGLANGTTVYVSGERNGYIGFGNRKIIINNADGTLTVEWERDSSIPIETITIPNCPEPMKVGTTSDISCSITPNTATNKNITWTSDNESVATVSMKTPFSATITAKAKGTATITVTSDSDSSKKATCVITVTEDDTPTTYEVTVNKNDAHCDVKPDTLGISTKSYADATHTSLILSGTNVLVYVKATRVGKKDKNWTTRVSGETEIYLGMYGSTCTWEDEEVTPTTYTVGVRNNSSCPADTMYLSLDEHDFEDHKTTLNVPSGTVVYMQAAKEGYNYQTLSHPITDNYTFTPTCDWEWGGEFEVNDGNDIHINVGDCVELSELITYTPSDYVPESVTFEKGEDEYSNAISVTETGKVCGLSETTRAASVRVTINDKHLVWVNVWVGGGTHLYQLKVMEESTPGQPMPSNPDIKVYIDGVPNTYADHTLSFNVAEGTPIKVTASKEGWTANINNEDRSEYSFNMPDDDYNVIIAWKQDKYTLSVTSNTPSGAGNPDVVINGVTYPDVSTTVQRQIGHGDSANITATLGGYTPTYKDHDTGTTITIPFTMIKNTWIDIDWTANVVTVDSITLDNSDMNLTYASCIQNETGSRTATVNYSDGSHDNSVTWSVPSNQNVISISNAGVITPLKVSSSPVTVTASAGGKTATFKVYVSEAHVKATSVNITEEDFEMNIGETVQLHATVDPYCAQIDWAAESNPSGVVSVNRNTGKVTANNAGTATVYARSEYADDESDAVHITVKPVIIPVTGVATNTNEMSVVRGTCQQIPVVVTVYPLDATNKNYTWTSNDTDIVTINSDGTQLCGIKKGTTTVTVTTEDGGYTADVTINVIPETYTINVESKQVTTGDTTTLTATFNPSTVSYPLTWTTQDSRITIINTSSDTHTVTVKGNFSGTSWIAATTEDGVRGEGGLTVVDPFTINSIDLLYNDQTLAKPIATRDFSLPTWSTIQMDITTPNPIDVTYSSTATGDILAGPDRIESGTGTYNFDAFCVSNEEPQEAPSVNSASFSFAGETFNVTWDGTYGRIHGNEGNG